jgi:ribosome maturation factor RimP
MAQAAIASNSLDLQLTALIEPEIAKLGYALVRVQLLGTGNGRTLQVMAERDDRAAMTVEDCATISRQLSELLDQNDPIQGTYQLEVSSPGIDRPLVKRQDFERFTGFAAKLETSEPLEVGGHGRRNFKGQLAGVRDGAQGAELELVIDSVGTVAIPLAIITKAKLLLTDALLKASKEQGLS